MLRINWLDLSTLNLLWNCSTSFVQRTCSMLLLKLSTFKKRKKSSFLKFICQNSSWNNAADNSFKLITLFSQKWLSQTILQINLKLNNRRFYAGLVVFPFYQQCLKLLALTNIQLPKKGSAVKGNLTLATSK